MGRTLTHQIRICTSCRRPGDSCRPGAALIARLQNALAMAGEAGPEVFEISGVDCMAGCDNACAVAFLGAQKTTYLFGDLDPDLDQDIDDLVAFARLYASLPDGWCKSAQRPGKMRTSTLARVPGFCTGDAMVKQ